MQVSKHANWLFLAVHFLIQTELMTLTASWRAQTLYKHLAHLMTEISKPEGSLLLETALLYLPVSAAIFPLLHPNNVAWSRDRCQPMRKVVQR